MDLSIDATILPWLILGWGEIAYFEGEFESAASFLSKIVMSLILALETSCDETAAAVVRDGREVLSSHLVSQVELHQSFGGVVPEVAARKHVETINQLVAQALTTAGIIPQDLSAVACTAGPGLIGALLVGLSCAKALAWAWNLPLITVDHLLAHVSANYINTDLEPPFVALLVSGGHTQIIYFKSYSEAQVLGQTLDDAAGEAFDKVARLLGLGYPGGPHIDRLAQTGNPHAFPFPEGMVAGYNFSFSGLKTAVLRAVEKLSEPLPIADLAASFQNTVVRVLVRKTLEAQRKTKASRVVLAGGVAANKELRAQFAEEVQGSLYFPDLAFCTDNAAMVGAGAFFCGKNSLLTQSAYARKRCEILTI